MYTIYIDHLSKFVSHVVKHQIKEWFIKQHTHNEKVLENEMNFV